MPCLNCLLALFLAVSMHNVVRWIQEDKRRLAVLYVIVGLLVLWLHLSGGTQ